VTSSWFFILQLSRPFFDLDLTPWSFFPRHMQYSNQFIQTRLPLWQVKFTIKCKASHTVPCTYTSEQPVVTSHLVTASF